jgi:coenzyme F420-reducing hydrogenase delta subunit
MVQVVNDAFAEGQDAVVVAGYSGEDTRQAANYLANYADNSEDLAGQETVELSTQQTQNAE